MIPKYGFTVRCWAALGNPPYSGTMRFIVLMLLLRLLSLSLLLPLQLLYFFLT